MPDTLSVPLPSGLASVPTTPTSTSTIANNDSSKNSKDNNRSRRQDSSSTSSATHHLSPTFPTAHHSHAQTSTTAATTTTIAQPSPSPSPSSSHSSSHSTVLTTGATAGEGGTETGTAVAVRMDASPIILFTLQYSVAVVQGVTIYILSVVFSILQLVSGQLNDPPPSSSSGSTNSGSGASKKKGVGSGDEGLQQRRQKQRRRRWSGTGSGSGSGTTSPMSTSGLSWAQNLIAHTQQTQAQQSQSIPTETHINAPTGGGGGGTGAGGTLAQRVEVLRFLGSTIANLVGSYARPTTSSSAFSSTGEDIESIPQKRHLVSSMSTGAGGTAAGGGQGGGVEMSYSSRIRRALVKTLSGHAIPLPRSIKRVTFNDTLQFHTTTTNRRQPRARFGDEDDEEEEDEDEEDEDSSPALRFFSGGFGAGVTLSPEEPMSTSPTPSVPLLVPGGGKKVKKNRPPSIMPSARDRRQVQEQDVLEDMAAAAAVQETGAQSSRFSVVSNGRSIPVSTTTMTPGFSTTAGKKLVSTITVALPPLSRPRKQQQQQSQTTTSPVMTIAATSTTTASGSATTTTTTTSMTPTTSYSPANGTSGLASALLSSLMMPASSGPISDVARSFLSPTTLEASAPGLSDSDSSKSSSGGRRGGSRDNLKRTRSAPSKITTFLQQHRLARQQQQQQGRGQMLQGLFSAGEYTSSPRDVSSPLPSDTFVVANANVATETESNTPLASVVHSATASSTTTAAPTVRARQPSTSSTTTLIRPRSLYSIQSTVSSAVAAVIGGEPPPSIPISLTTSMSRSLSPRLEPTTFSPTAAAFSSTAVAFLPMTATATTTFSPTHQRKRSASVDLTNIPSLRLPSSPSTETTSTPGHGSALESPATPTSPGSSGGRSLMYKLTHPQRYKREVELQLQSQHQKDTSSLSSATSSPSASQVALTPLSPTGSTTSIQGILQQETASVSATATTRTVYPFSRSFTDLPASLSYLSDDPHPAHLPPPQSYSSVSVELPSPTTTAFVATAAEIHHPHPLPLTPPSSDKDMIPAAAIRESTTPPISMFFPSPTTQHRTVLVPLPSPALSSSSSPTTTSATAMLSSMKDSLVAQLQRSPSLSPRSVSEDEDEDEDGAGAHTTFAACGFTLATSSSSS
ncbi:hypothetical protein K457DRAFT_20513 [Linnemannia elongata AG-77]|uniref:Uncharacterized protein n=1 Tax=Linnemannia elongata AG-77 TaxID=1314771 RepID=A0A197JUX5_9FUNG|nr:hypothetical protein K457DRAFT_20513 [Linnemannia elongata AG-77]